MRTQIIALLLPLALFVGCGGSSANVKSGPMPDNGTWSGVYHSPQYGDMNLIQNGSSVVGDYKMEMRTGKIQGEAEGDLLRFEWVEHKAMVSNRPQETRGHGYFKFVVDKGNGDHVLKGEWGMGDNDTGGGEWNAYKLKNKEPHLSSESDKSSGGESDDSSSSGTTGTTGASDDQSKDDDLF